MQTDEEVGKVAQAVPIIIYILFKLTIKIILINYLYNLISLLFVL